MLHEFDTLPLQEPVALVLAEFVQVTFQLSVVWLHPIELCDKVVPEREYLLLPFVVRAIVQLSAADEV